MFEYGGYLGLFLAAFDAATLLPMQSEAVLGGLLISERFSTAILLVVATTGNVLGSVVNWLLGRGIEAYREKRWFPVKQASFEKAKASYERYGYWSLLLSWVPIIGDPLTVIAGVMKEPLWRFVLIVTLAKGGRYLVLAILILENLS